MMTEKKLFIINRTFYPDQSATSQILTDAVCYLSDRWKNICIITGSLDKSYTTNNDKSVLFGSNINVYRIPAFKFNKSLLASRMFNYIIFYIYTAAHLLRSGKKGDIILVKTDPPLINAIVVLISIFKKFTICNWWQDIYPETAFFAGVYLPKSLYKFLILIRNLSIIKATHNIAISSTMEHSLIKFGGERNKITVINNWTNDRLILPNRKSNTFLREKYNLSNKFVVGYSGNLGRAHECETILNSALLLKNENIVFLFIAGGYGVSYLKSRVINLEINDLFVFLDPVDEKELPNTLPLPDVHWISFPPHFEGLILPSKFYGICAAGRPTIVIGEKNGELSKIIVDSNSGFSVQVGDCLNLANIIKHLLQNPEICDQMGFNARRLLEKNYTRSKSLSTLERVLSNL